jgi:phosphate starvation-inducible PhoH-like protein
VGDEVLTSDGLATQVINVFPQGKRPIYRIRLSDGGETRCTADHLWRVREEGEEAWKTVPLAAIIANVLGGKRFELPEVGRLVLERASNV